MNIWLMTVGEPLPKFNSANRALRTQVLAQTLSARGHNVTWWTSTFDHFGKVHFPIESEIVNIDNIYNLQFIHGVEYKKNISWQRFMNHWQIARDFTAKSAKFDRPDVIICSLPTLELSDAAVKFGRKIGCPVILDVRDLWPDEIVARFPVALQALGRMLVLPLTRMSKRAAIGATAIVGVSRAYLDWGLAHAGRGKGPCDAVIPLGHPGRSPTVPSDNGALARLVALGVDPSKTIIASVGTFGNSVDLGTVIDASNIMDRDDVQFVFAGTGDRDVEWRDMARNNPRIIFTGWVGGAEIAALLEHAKIGLVSYRPGTLIAMPNKIFEYLCYGVPLMNSIPGEAATLVRDNGVGLNYEAGNIADLTRALTSLLADQPRHHQMAAAASALFATAFSSASVYGRYSDLIETVANQGCGTTPESSSPRSGTISHAIDSGG